MPVEIRYTIVIILSTITALIYFVYISLKISAAASALALLRTDYQYAERVGVLYKRALKYRSQPSIREYLESISPRIYEPGAVIVPATAISIVFGIFFSFASLQYSDVGGLASVIGGSNFLGAILGLFGFSRYKKALAAAEAELTAAAWSIVETDGEKGEADAFITASEALCAASADLSRIMDAADNFKEVFSRAEAGFKSQDAAFAAHAEWFEGRLEEMRGRAKAFDESAELVVKAMEVSADTAQKQIESAAALILERVEEANRRSAGALERTAEDIDRVTGEFSREINAFTQIGKTAEGIGQSLVLAVKSFENLVLPLNESITRTNDLLRQTSMDMIGMAAACKDDLRDQAKATLKTIAESADSNIRFYAAQVLGQGIIPIEQTGGNVKPLPSPNGEAR